VLDSDVFWTSTKILLCSRQPPPHARAVCCEKLPNAPSGATDTQPFSEMFITTYNVWRRHNLKRHNWQLQCLPKRRNSNKLRVSRPKADVIQADAVQHAANRTDVFRVDYSLSSFNCFTRTSWLSCNLKTCVPFKSQPRYRLSWRVPWSSSVFPGECQDSTLKYASTSRFQIHYLLISIKWNITI
jgi:hypothetical protein